MKLHDIFAPITEAALERQGKQHFGIGTWIFGLMCLAIVFTAVMDERIGLSISVLLTILSGAYVLHLDIVGQRVAAYLKQLRN